MTALAAGLGLAVIASVALNGSYLLQHAGSVRVPAVDALHPLRTFAGLLTAPLWLVGLALGLAGWALHVAALTRAPLSLVQAFVAGGLALTVPAARRFLKRPIGRREALAVVGMAASLAVLPLGIASSPAAHPPGGLAAIAFLALAAALPTGLAALGVRLRRPDLLAAAGGVLYGAADVAIKVLTGVFSDHGLGAVVSSHWLLAAAALTVSAFFAFQRSLQLASPVTAIALMTAGTYVVSIGGALALLHDPLGQGTSLAALHAAALAVVVVAAWALSRSQAELSRDAVAAR